MRWLFDALYLAAAILTLPVWLWRVLRTGRSRTDWAARFGKVEPSLVPRSRPRLLLHAVSVGEVNAIRTLVEQLEREAAALDLVIATTTDTGFQRAQALWGNRHRIVRYPLDFSPAVMRFLAAVRPDAVALIELEVWPNFTRACARRGIPLCVVNGRLSARSFRRYQWVQPLVRPSFRRLKFVAAQDQAIAQRFEALGVNRQSITVTGTMKWDTAQIADDVPGSAELAKALGIDRSRPLIVGGSTAPGEHELLHAATPRGVQLLCAPRRPEWFDQAAAAMPGCVRRSQAAGAHRAAADRFLLDTIGELRQAYALADIVVVGRSFGDLHGSDMMEPIALGKATIVGPAHSDFQEAMNALRAGGGVVDATAATLASKVHELLADPHRRAELAHCGRAVIRCHQGATSRTAELLLSVLQPRLACSNSSEPDKNEPAASAINRNGGGGERRKAWK